MIKKDRLVMFKKLMIIAVGVRFELTTPFPEYRISSAAYSTALAPHQLYLKITSFLSKINIKSSFGELICGPDGAWTHNLRNAIAAR